MLDNPLAYIPSVVGAIGIVAAASRFVAHISKPRRETAYRRWTERQEAQILNGGPGFRLQVFRTAKAPLEWAVSQGRLRVTKNMPWGWYVMAETRLLPNREPPP